MNAVITILMYVGFVAFFGFVILYLSAYMLNRMEGENHE